MTSKDGQTAPHAATITGSVTLSDLEGYYADEDCTIPLELEVYVDWTGDAAADEAAALTALPTAAYAKYNDGMKFAVSIEWTLDGAFDGKQFAVNAYTGAVTSTVENWKDYTDSLEGSVTLRGAMYTDAEDYSFPIEDHTSNENVDFSNGTGRRGQMFVLEQKSYVGKVEVMFSAYTGTKNVIVNLKPAKEDGNPDDSNLLATATIESSLLAENGNGQAGLSGFRRRGTGSGQVLHRTHHRSGWCARRPDHLGDYQQAVPARRHLPCLGGRTSWRLVGKRPIW